MPPQRILIGLSKASKATEKQRALAAVDEQITNTIVELLNRDIKACSDSHLVVALWEIGENGWLQLADVGGPLDLDDGEDIALAQYAIGLNTLNQLTKSYIPSDFLSKSLTIGRGLTYIYSQFSERSLTERFGMGLPPDNPRNNRAMNLEYLVNYLRRCAVHTEKVKIEAHYAAEKTRRRH